MKRMIFLLALAGTLGVAVAEDSYLYWMIPKYAEGTQRGGTGISGEYKAKVVAFEGSEWAETGGTYLDIWSSANGGLGSLVSSAEGGAGVDVTINTYNVPYFAGVTDGIGMDWTYFVELYHDNKVVAHSEGLLYSEAGYAVFDGITMPTTQWMPAAFVPAPEPSSGLLLLLGVAGLALRRRKQIAA